MFTVHLIPAEHPSGVALEHSIRELCAKLKVPIVCAPAAADVSLGPLVRRRIPASAAAWPRLGTLIFHPSLLPLYRGPDAVRWVVARHEKFTGATWFWCAPELDGGDICEQELVPVPENATPRELYNEILVPAGLRCLERALTSMLYGVVRRVPQWHTAASVFGPYVGPKTDVADTIHALAKPDSVEYGLKLYGQCAEDMPS